MSRFQKNDLPALLFHNLKVIYNWLETMGKHMTISTKCSCVYIYMCVYIYIYVYIYIHVHTHIYV